MTILGKKSIQLEPNIYYNDNDDVITDVIGKKTLSNANSKKFHANSNIKSQLKTKSNVNIHFNINNLINDDTEILAIAPISALINSSTAKKKILDATIVARPNKIIDSYVRSREYLFQQHHQQPAPEQSITKQTLNQQQHQQQHHHQQLGQYVGVGGAARAAYSYVFGKTKENNDKKTVHISNKGCLDNCGSSNKIYLPNKNNNHNDRSSKHQQSSLQQQSKTSMAAMMMLSTGQRRNAENVVSFVNRKLEGVDFDINAAISGSGTSTAPQRSTSKSISAMSTMSDMVRDSPKIKTAASTTATTTVITEIGSSPRDGTRRNSGQRFPFNDMLRGNSGQKLSTHDDNKMGTISAVTTKITTTSTTHNNATSRKDSLALNRMESTLTHMRSAAAPEFVKSAFCNDSTHNAAFVPPNSNRNGGGSGSSSNSSCSGSGRGNSDSSYVKLLASSSFKSERNAANLSAAGGGGGFNSGSPCYFCGSLIARCCFHMPMLKAINVRRCVLALFAITVVSILYYTHYVDNGVFVGLIQRDTRPSPLINCRMIPGGKHVRGVSPATDHRSEARLRIDPKVLVFVETTYSGLGRDIAELLVYNRIKYKIEVAGKSLPVLTNLDKGRYGVIVFENLEKYLQMDKWNRELLDKYCREYSVGIVGFVIPSEESLVAAQLRDFPLYVHTNLRLRDATLNPSSPVLRLTRAGETAWGILPGDDWAVFQHNHSTYQPIAWAQRNAQDYPSEIVDQVQLPLTTVLQDHGQFDGIQRVMFGSSLRFWLHRLLFLDALSYLSHGQLSLSLERMLLVDVDDIFVGEKGTRLRPDDVRAMIATQKIIAAMVPGFRFNLGFSGKYYHHGTREENQGDDFLLRNVNEFNWFSHMWKHQQPHLYDNLTQLMGDMQLNYAFAKEHNIPTDSGYSISPHHSGVYPAHEILYVAWKKVWNVKVTSTEEYPHLRPARLRRGFKYRNIMVLPRQTCGLFTHTMYIDRYPGGRDKLDESIQGGELFQTIVNNPINIFMTHMSNYGSDRLALYTFQSVIKFLQCWTNLKLVSAPPVQLAEMYFRLHPEEIDPVWGNPCDDVRHKKIWSKTKSCDSLPKFLVIGPQKTGTTALYTFLSMHSSIASNVPSPETFEEIQFFNGNNYYRGLDWYMDFFPNPVELNATLSSSVLSTPATQPPTTRYFFEKSATYFDGEMVPKRAHALLPHAKIVAILISPAKRAYSWYQHQRAHGDIIANNYSFYQVITATDSAPKALRDLRNRCLSPGKYAQHLEHWLAYFPAQQLHIIDGEQLRLNPVNVMNDLQRFLKIQPILDYSNHLRFDVKKGFFCQVISEKRNKCLGKSKGRQYASMDERSVKLLQRYYLNHNTALVKLLKKLGSRPIPQWLKDDLSTGT